MRITGKLCVDVDVSTKILPTVVKPGECIRLRTGKTSFLFLFNNEADRDVWRDTLNERIFDLNHPARHD